MNTRIFGGGLAVILAAAWSFSGAASGQQGPSGTGGVAVVNTTDLFNSLQMVKDLERRFEEERATVQNEANTRREKIATLQKELASGIFAADSPDYAEREAQAERSQLEAELWIRNEERRLRRKHKEYMARIYQYIEQACGDLARSEGLDLVLTDNPLDLNVPDSNALVEQILRKKIIFASPRLDLTGRVRERVNALYSSAGGAESIRLK